MQKRRYKRKFYLITIFNKDGVQLKRKIFDDYYDVLSFREKYIGCSYSIEVVE